MSVQPSTVSRNTPLPIRKGILVIVLAGILMVGIYCVGILSKDWLNRLGIIINIVTGLLFAPAVLDTNGYFGQAIPWLERRMHRLYNSLSVPLPALTQWLDNLIGKKESKFRFALLSFVLSIPIFLGLARNPIGTIQTLLIILYPVGIFFVILEIVRDMVNRKPVAFRGLLFTSVLFPYILPLLLVTTPIIYAIWIALRFSSFATHGLHGTFSEHEQLRRALIGWGICLFVLGSIFQLIATF